MSGASLGTQHGGVLHPHLLRTIHLSPKQQGGKNRSFWTPATLSSSRSAVGTSQYKQVTCS